MTSKEKPEFGYQFQGFEAVEGPFKSENEALLRASEVIAEHHYALPMKMSVGVVRWAEPTESIKAMTIEDVMERMEESACDDEFGWAESEIFALKAGGKAAFEEALQQWARDWVKPNLWTLQDEVEWSLGIDGEWRKREKPGAAKP